MVKWLYTRSPKQRLGIPISNIIIVSDASKTGWGFMINGSPYRGEFDTSMTKSRGFSSNMKELMTIWFAILILERRDSVILVRTDNVAALSAINKANSTNTI